MSKAKKIIIFIVLIAILVIPFGITASAVSLTSVCITGKVGDTGEVSVGSTRDISYDNSWISFTVDGISGTMGYLNCKFVVEVIGSWLGTFPLQGASYYFTGSYSPYAISNVSYDVEVNQFYTSPSWYSYGHYTRIEFTALVPLNNSNISRVLLDFDDDSGDQTGNSLLKFISAEYSFLTAGEYEAIARDNENTDKIIQNNDENTDKIIDNQNQLQENEKNEAQSSGSSGSDDVASAVPDKSAGFTEALSTFVRSMSTTDTECNLTFPALSIPEIAGLIPAANLSAEQNINFSQVVAMIPTSILEIVRALATIALIIYCFKELYSTISYVLTMRRDKGDE